MSTIFSLLSIILDISIPFVLLESIEGQDPKFAQTSCNGLKKKKKRTNNFMQWSKFREFAWA